MPGRGSVRNIRELRPGWLAGRGPQGAVARRARLASLAGLASPAGLAGATDP